MTAADKIARTADGLSADFAAQLTEVLRDTERGLRPVLTAAGAGSATAVVKAARANRTRRQIRDVLLAAGYQALVDAATGTVLDTMVNAVLAGRALADLDAVLTDTVALKIDALKQLFAVTLLDQGDDVTRALWQATVRGVFASRPIDAILADLSDVLDRSEAQVRTLYDTNVSIFGRQVEALQAGDDPDTVFVYLGPVDKKTRPFCLEHVGRVYTRQDLDALDNGASQPKPVFLTGGGFNCRHIWQEVSKFSSLRDLLGTDRRAPEVQQQIDQLRAKPVKKAA